MTSLFLGERTILQWREAGRATHAKHLARLLKQADTYHAYLPPEEHPSETITYTGMAVANLALAYLLTQDARYLETARKWIARVISYPHWGKAHMPDHDLDAGWLSFGLGLGYDWLKNDLPTAEREALRAKLLLQGTRLYNFAVESEGQWWSSAYWQNHNWICYAGLLAAAYALESEHPATKCWSARAIENFRAVMSVLPEDGSDYEGVVYWCYGVLWLQIAAELIRQRAGFELPDHFLRHTFFYRLYMSAPNLIDTANYGDCHDRRSAHSAAMYHYSARVFRDGHAQWLIDHFEQTGEWERERREGLLRPGMSPQAFLEFLWCDPTVTPTPINDLPLTRTFSDVGLVCARSSWTPAATFFVFKCGAPSGQKAHALGHALHRAHGWDVVKGGHAHPDENSFIFVRGQDYLAVDEGYSQKKQSSQHNTVLVDGRGQYNEGVYNVSAGVDWAGKLEESFVTDVVIYARGEAASAYDPSLKLTRFTRQALFINHRYVVLCDDLAAAEPRQFSWLLQTDVPPQTQGETFLYHVGESRLRAAILQPTTRTFETKEQAIVAYPSSSTPEWVLCHPQHTLVVHSPRVKVARFVSALCAEAREGDETKIESRENGLELEGRTRVLFAPDERWLLGEHGRGQWLVVNYKDPSTPGGVSRSAQDALHSFASGEALEIIFDKQLWFAASERVNVAYQGDRWIVGARGSVWVSLRAAAAPREVRVNGQTVTARFESDLALCRLYLAGGRSEITLAGMC